MTRIGSLFSGAGGLDLAVQAVFGGTVAWHCENDPAASKVLAHHWPHIPNHGDITTTDWAQVEPVDILCGGWPCQPFSLAGQRKGHQDDRALWPYVARAVRLVRPRHVVLENVSAVLGPEFSRVANDLAALGYDITWTCLRASDVGAPHRRERVFILATDTDQSGPAARNRWGSSQCAGRVERATPHSPRDGRHEGRPAPARVERGSDAAVSGAGFVELLPTPAARDFKGHGPAGMDRNSPNMSAIADLLPMPLARDGRQAAPGDYARHTPSLAAVDFYLPTPNAADGSRGQDFARANRDGSGGDDLVTLAVKAERDSQWGKYEPAIRRWETRTRPAPPPTEPNTKGNPRLNPAFSEWMMGWPGGWVTQVPGISRNDALRIIGNGVCPQQATAALRWLLSVCEAAA